MKTKSMDRFDKHVGGLQDTMNYLPGVNLGHAAGNRNGGMEQLRL
jgi:hypothetical protein